MSSLVSELILRLKDDVSPGAKAIQAALNKIVDSEKAVGKQSAEMKKLVSELDRLKNATNAVDSFNKQRKALADARSAFSAARDNVKKLATEITAVDKPTRAMSAAFKAAQREVKATAEAFRLQVAATKEAKSAMAGFDISVTAAASAEGRLKSSIEQTTQALRRQTEADTAAAKAAQVSAQRRREAAAAAKDAAKAALGYGAMVVGGGIEHGTVEAVENAAEYAAQRNRVFNVSGRNAAEVAQADKLATGIAAQYPLVTRSGALEDYLELRKLAGTHDGGVDPKLLAKNVGVMAKARTAAAASGVKLEQSDALNLAMAVEGSGRAADPRAQEMIVDAYLRAKQVYGTAIDSSKIRDFVANAKAANFPMNDASFYYTGFARLAQGNASRLGNEFSQTMSTLVGGKMTKQSAQWLVKMGLIRQNQIKDGKGGKFYIAGDIKGKDLLSADQTSWAQQFLLAGLEKNGVVSDKNVNARMASLKAAELKANPSAQINEEVLRERAVHGLISDELQRAGFRSTVSDNLIHSIANEVLINKDVAQMKRTTGIEAADTIGRNPVASFQELTNAISNLTAIAADPAVSAVSGTLDSMAKGIGAFSAQVAAFQKENPALAGVLSGTAIGVGALGGGALAVGGGKAVWDALSSGFGLKGSAIALNESAAALTAAAGRLGVAGAVGSATSAEAGVAVGVAGAVKKGAGSLLWRGVKNLAKGGLFGFVAGSILDYLDPAGNLGGVTSGVDAWSQKHLGFNPSNVDPLRIMDNRARAVQQQNEKDAADGKLLDPIFQSVPQTTDAGAQAGQNIASGLSSQLGAVEAAAERIFAAIASKLSKGVDVPIRLQQQGMSTVTGTHADYGISHELSE